MATSIENAKTNDAKTELAQKVLRIASETNDDPVARFTMMKLATDIAVQGSDVETTFAAIESMEKAYRITGQQFRLQALSGLIQRSRVSDREALLPRIVRFCRAAAEQDDLGPAVNLLATAQKSFRSGQSRNMIMQLSHEVAEAHKQCQSLEPAFAKLETVPDDAESNLSVGRYRCFVLRDWVTGLFQLSQGSDAALSEIASAEMSAGNDNAKLVTLADRWWDYAEQVGGAASASIKLHAADLYRKGLSDLSGLKKVKASKRLKECDSLTRSLLAADTTDRSPVPTGLPTAGIDETGPIQVEVDLPAPFDDVEVGGGGRFLIFKLTSLSKLAFFDVAARKVTQFVDLDSSDVLFTAGSEAFYVLTRPQNLIERWSLREFKKQATVKLPFDTPVQELAMGCGSRGPIYAGAETGSGVLLDGRTLRPLTLSVYDHQYNRPGEIHGAGRNAVVRVSGNGSVFTLQQTSISPSGFRTFLLGKRGVHVYYRGDSMGYLAPTFDGALVYTSRGIYTNQAKAFAGTEKGLGATSFRIPAVTGDYAIGIPRDDRSREASKTHVHVLASGQVEPILTIPDVAIRPGQYGDFHGKRDSISLDRRVFFVPDLKSLVTLPAGNKTVVSRRLDLEEEFKRSGEDYLFVMSKPPGAVLPGSTFKYQIQVRSKSDGVKYELASGPKGMTVNDKGLVIWRTQRRIELDQDAIVTITNSGGQELSHVFKVKVGS